MKYRGKEIGTPTLAMIQEYVSRKNFLVSPTDIYNHYKKRNWMSKTNRPIKTLEGMVDAWNGVQLQKSRKITKGLNSKKLSKKDALAYYNTNGYLNDLEHICKIGFIDRNTRDWIETNMTHLRETANAYEIEFASKLLADGVQFIHQAPFIFSGKIYFADFFIPSKHLIIEIDGIYHEGERQSRYDRFRDECFNGHRIRVIRMPNQAVFNDNDLKILLSKHFN